MQYFPYPIVIQLVHKIVKDNVAIFVVTQLIFEEPVGVVHLVEL